MARKRTPKNQDRLDQRAARRKATLAAAGTRGWLTPSRTEPNRKKQLSKDACRGRVRIDS